MAILLFCICSCQQYTDCFGFSTLYFPFFHISQVDEQLRRAQKLLKQSQKRDYYKILGVKRYVLYCTGGVRMYTNTTYVRTLHLVYWNLSSVGFRPCVQWFIQQIMNLLKHVGNTSHRNTHVSLNTVNFRYSTTTLSAKSFNLPQFPSTNVIYAHTSTNEYPVNTPNSLIQHNV